MKAFLLACLISLPLFAADAPFDWQRAKGIHARAGRGEQISPDERTILDEAIRRHAAGEPIPPDTAPPASGPREPTAHFTPLTELKEKYRGEDGGLYGGGLNNPPPAHAALATAALAQIRPLDAEGKPAGDGKVVLLSIGMSNTTQEFSTFVPMANADPKKAPLVVLVDGAQGARDANAWAAAEANPWQVAQERLTAARVTPQQVQAVWIKQAIAAPHAGFPAEMERLRDRLRDIVTLAKQKYPNLRVAYLSSRIYAGYASTQLNPEPYAYEGAFAVRWLIQEQMKATPSLNADATRGEVKAPVLLWGPYLWADGTTPRAADQLSYAMEDLGPDGTHPSRSGQKKVADQLLTFFTTHPLARTWFTSVK